MAPAVAEVLRWKLKEPELLSVSQRFTSEVTWATPARQKISAAPFAIRPLCSNSRIATKPNRHITYLTVAAQVGLVARLLHLGRLDQHRLLHAVLIALHGVAHVGVTSTDDARGQ